MTTLRFVGAYRVTVPIEERRAAMRCHGSDKAQVEAELASVALIELEVCDAEKGLSLEMFHHVHSDCVPYNEEYFDLLTLRHIDADQYRSPDRRKYRVAFHLH